MADRRRKGWLLDCRKKPQRPFYRRDVRQIEAREDSVMKMHAGLSQRMDQRMALAPKMLQSIEVLQMSTFDLVGLIEQELAQNEVLDALVPEVIDTPVDPTGRDEQDFDPELYRPRARLGEDDPKQAMLNNVAGPESGLGEYLRSQLIWRELVPDLRAKVELAIDALDDRGLLPLDDDELSELVGAADVGSVMEVLCSLEPRGIGSRTPIEAMLCQVAAGDPDRALIETLLRHYLDDLSRNKIPDVARELSISVDDLQVLLDRLRLLDPRPGAAFGVQGERQIFPDLVVERDPDGEYRVVVDDVALPVLQINPDYAAMVQSGDTEPEVRSYLRDKMRAARDLMSAVQQRRDTLVRVGASVMSRQAAFLEHGRSRVRPLKMADVADELGLHNSTISRAIAGKHVQTPHGVLALRDFFDGARRPNGRTRASGDKGRMAIQHEIRRLIAEEDCQNPLSDDDIVVRLSQIDIRVARRTVAKHRKELGIRSSWQRKKHSGQ